jgi:hypothetical protein
MSTATQIVAAWSALAFVLAGCGSNGVPPETWARSVCLAVKPWSTHIDASVTQARAKITSASDPTQTKSELVALFGGAQRASAEAVAKVQKAGVPDADNGQQVTAQFVAALKAAEEQFGRAAAGVNALSTADRSAFYSGVVKVGDQLSKDNNASSKQLRDVRSTTLERAFERVPECR